MSHEAAEVLQPNLRTVVTQATALRNKKGDLAGALALLKPHSETARANDPKNIPYWQLLGTIYRDTSDATQAMIAYDQGLRIALMLNKDVEAADLRRSQAFSVLYLENDPERAEQLLSEAEELLGKHDSKKARKVKVNIHTLHGNLLFTQGEYLRANGFFGQALFMARELQIQHRIITLSGDLADTYIQLGAPDQAINLLEKVLPDARARYRHSVPPFLIRLSHAHRAIGNLDQARAYAEEALSIAQQEGRSREVDQAQEVLHMLPAISR